MTLLQYVKGNVSNFVDTTVERNHPERRVFIETLLEESLKDPIAMEMFGRPIDQPEVGEFLQAIILARALSMHMDATDEIVGPLVQALIAFAHEAVNW
jgi:hypothetical protein